MKNQKSPIVLNAQKVEALLPRLDVLSVLTDMFKALGQNKAVQPSQTLTPFPTGIGDFITYMGAIDSMGVFGAKLSPYIVTDKSPIVTAWTCLMSMDTGRPLVWCDSGQLTTERTAGTSALAIDLLSPKEAQHLSIIGSGAVAEAHFRHVIGLREWATVSVFSPSLTKDPDRMARWSSLGKNVEIATDSKSCLEGSDVVMLCTSSSVPVVMPSDTGKNSVFTSISTNALNAHEVPPEFLNSVDVYCDYRPTTPDSAGEMKIASASGDWSAENICGDLPGLVCGTCPPPSGDKSVFFRSIGLGLEDIAMAYGIWCLADGS